MGRFPEKPLPHGAYPGHGGHGGQGGQRGQWGQGSTLLQSFLNLFFPEVCPLCEGGLTEGAFCAVCNAGFDAVRTTGPICLICGARFTSNAGPDRTCGKCMDLLPPYTCARSAFLYDGAILDAVHRFKYGGAVTLASPLGTLLADYCLKIELKPQVIVPVPLHAKRLKMRGFNQSLLLARALRKRLCADLDYLNLKRVVPTKPQAGLKAVARHDNVAGAFLIRDPEAFRGKRVLLVDDVFTTGATVSECSKLLRKSGAVVFVITLARAVKS